MPKRAMRVQNLEYRLRLAITYGLGANVTVNPGVTIGDNTVIGSGSVVTKDIPSNVIAVGNPCRVLREITEEEKAEWRQKHQELLEELGK